MGQTFTLSHLVPFVDISRQRIAKQLDKELEGIYVSTEQKKQIVESRLKDEIKRGVQTIQYQCATCSNMKSVCIITSMQLWTTYPKSRMKV